MVYIRRGCFRDLFKICVCLEVYLFYFNYMFVYWKGRNDRGYGLVG